MKGKNAEGNGTAAVDPGGTFNRRATVTTANGEELSTFRHALGVVHVLSVNISIILQWMPVFNRYFYLYGKVRQNTNIRLT